MPHSSEVDETSCLKKRVGSEGRKLNHLAFFARQTDNLHKIAWFQDLHEGTFCSLKRTISRQRDLSR